MAAPSGLVPLGISATRDAFLYVPRNYRVGHPAPLLVLLHGATQSARLWTSNSSLFSLADSALLTYAQKLVHNQRAHVTVLDAADVFHQSPELLDTFQAMQRTAPDLLELKHATAIDPESISDQDLLLIGLDSWRRAVAQRSPWLPAAPSMLIMRT